MARKSNLEKADFDMQVVSQSRPVYDAPLTQEQLDGKEGLDEPTDVEKRAVTIASELQRAGELAPQEMIDDVFDIPADFLSQDQLYIRVHAVNSDGKRPYLGRANPRNFDLETLKREYGGGNFWVCLVGPNPKNGGRGSVFWQAFPIVAGAPKEVKSEAPVATAPVESSMMLEGFRALATGMQQGFALLAEQLKPSAPPTTLRDQLQDLAMLQGLFPKPEKTDSLGMVKDIFALVREMNPPDPGDSPMGMMMSAADKILPMLNTVLENSKQQALSLPPVTSQQSQPQPQQRQNPQQQQPTGQDEMQLQQLKLKMGLNFLCERASVGSDPELQADNVIDHMPEEDLRAFVDKTEWFEILTSVESKVSEHKEWFVQLREAVIAALSEEADFEDRVQNDPS